MKPEPQCTGRAVALNRAVGTGVASAARILLLRALALLGIVLVLAFAAPEGRAQSEGPIERGNALLADLDREAESIEERMTGELEPGQVEALLNELVSQRDRLPPVIEVIDQRTLPIRSQLEALGPAPEDGRAEDENLARERSVLTQRLSELEGLKRRLGQADARAASQLDRLADLRRRLFTDTLLSRDLSIFEGPVVQDGVREILDAVGEIAREAQVRAETEFAMEAVAGRLLAPMGIALVGAVLLLALRRVVLQRVAPMLTREIGASRKIAVAVAVTLARLLLPAIGLTFVLVAAASSDLLGAQGEAAVRGLGQTALLVIGAYALGGAFFAPGLPQIRLSHLDEACASKAHRWMMVLAGIVGLDRWLVASSTGFELGFEAVVLCNLVLVTFGGMALWRFERALMTHDHARDDETPEDPDAAEDPDAPERHGPGLLTILLRLGRIVLLTAAVVSPLLALAGYFAASRIVFYNPVETAGLIGIFILLFTVVREVVEKLAVGAEAAAGATTPAARPVPGVRLLPVAVGFILIVIAVPITAIIWGAEEADITASWQVIRDGFAVGEVTIAPLDFAAFIAVFAVFYLLTRVAQGVLSRSVLPVMGLDAGARAAIVAGVGYLGVIVSSLAAISVAGLDLSNIAIVAGALSVGIGFGLQNVVNNFVSGLILLIERPIKAGDWVQLNSGMGYVQRVNVRSTVIETFDRASLIVPNSELVSATVINWTHTNLNGRVIVAVKVAMGSDPREVERIMVEIARAHPMVLRRPQPFVLFRGYGEYAMNFEVRAVLRDVNWILNVQSDFYFEIHKRFAEAGIEIPVQRSEIALQRMHGSAAATVEPPGDQGAVARGIESGPRPHPVAASADTDAGGPGDAR